MAIFNSVLPVFKRAARVRDLIRMDADYQSIQLRHHKTVAVGSSGQTVPSVDFVWQSEHLGSLVRRVEMDGAGQNSVLIEAVSTPVIAPKSSVDS